MPGFFPVSSVCMISEKAADVIMADNSWDDLYHGSDM
jgi:hypothetical protein